jgi:hypothetical protein
MQPDKVGTGELIALSTPVTYIEGQPLKHTATGWIAWDATAIGEIDGFLYQETVTTQDSDTNNEGTMVAIMTAGDIHYDDIVTANTAAGIANTNLVAALKLDIVRANNLRITGLSGLAES